MTPTHEDLARSLKASRLACAAERCGFSADDVETVNAVASERVGFWKKLAQLAGTNAPSDATKLAVIAEMRRMAEHRAQNPDPFAGLSK